MPEKRLVDDWLAGYLSLTSEQESPESLHLWTALTVISASIRRKVWIDLEQGKVFPNIYVIIVAESARVRKSTAMDIGRDLLIDAIPDMRIMRDSMTSQGLIKSMNHKVQVIKDDKITEELRSDVAIFADEVANLFSYERTRASQMVIFLTRTYGCPGIYDHTTVRDSTVRLHNLYPVLLGGTDPRNLKVLPDDAVGGLTGRLIWVVESQRRKNNSGWKRDSRKVLERQALREALMHDLQCIAKLQGEVKVETRAMDLFDDWYNTLAQKDIKDPEIDAFYQRCHTTALRLAILVSLSKSSDMVITSNHMKAGIALIEQVQPEMKRIAVWAGNSQFEQQRAKFLDYMQKSGGISTRRRIMKHMGMLAQDFDNLSNTLVQDGSIEIASRPVGNEIPIRLTKEGLSNTARNVKEP